jgi:hypothetical protein
MVNPGRALENSEVGVPAACAQCYITRIESDLIFKGDPAQ